MASATCPQCGFVQEGGDECQRCGILFSRARAPRPPRVRPPAAEPAPAAAADTVESLRPARSVGSVLLRCYRVFRWVALAVSVGALILVLRTSPPPRIEPDPRGAERAEAKLAVLGQARGEVARPVELDEGELNAWLQRNLALAPAPGAPAADPSVEQVRSNVKDFKVQLLADGLRAWVLFDFHGKDITLTLDGRLFTQDGMLRIEPTAARLGSLPVPRATLERAMTRVLAEAHNAENLRLPPDIADVRVTNGRLVITPAAGAVVAPRFPPPAPRDLPPPTPELRPQEPGGEPSGAGDSPQGADSPAPSEER
jgi:hypothetical protein